MQATQEFVLKIDDVSCAHNVFALKGEADFASVSSTLTEEKRKDRV